jgi:hypothetical protein
MTLRLAALVAILLAFVVGAFLRLGPHPLTPDREALHRPATLAFKPGDQLGSFVVENARDQTRLSLSLRTPICRAPVFVTSESVFGAAPERLMALAFPEPPWRTVYVFEGRALASFSRFDALVDFLWSRLKTQLSLSRLDPAKWTYFAYRIPTDCRLGAEALIAVAQQIRHENIRSHESER